MRYFYIFPFKRQYYLPKEIVEYPFFKTFFKPYSKLGAIFWWLWNNLSFFKYLFTVKEKEITDEISVIKKNIDKNIVLAINTGTKGFTQKITALGINKENSKKIFLKYSNKKRTRELTTNEINILQLIEPYGCSPKLLFSKIDEHYVILITEYLEGKKFDNIKLDDNLLSLILKIADFDVALNTSNVKQGFKLCFAHGDFCPWNLLEVDNDITPIDWEFAKKYPLGFDLFTYIFQTSFLTMPNKTIPEIIRENESSIKRYFKNWDIDQWKPYLKEFSEIKLTRGDVKEESHLFQLFISLKEYAKET